MLHWFSWNLKSIRSITLPPSFVQCGSEIGWWKPSQQPAKRLTIMWARVILSNITWQYICKCIWHINFSELPLHAGNELFPVSHFFFKLSRIPNSVTSTPSYTLHWLKITESIEYKILSLTYKVLTAAKPSYLHHLITVHPHCSTRSSSVVTQSHPPSSSLRITDRSFHYASPHLWNQLPASLRQPRAGLSILDSDLPMHVSSALCMNSPLSLSITQLFHSCLKTYLFHKSFPP